MEFLIDCAIGLVVFAGYVVFCLLTGGAGGRFRLKD